MANEDQELEDFSTALIDFIENEGVLLYRKKLADKFRQEAPSKSGKSRKAIRDTMDGFELPPSLIYVSEGNRRKDGIVSGGNGFIDKLLDEGEVELWLEVIEEWAQSQGIVDSIVID